MFFFLNQQILGNFQYSNTHKSNEILASEKQNSQPQTLMSIVDKIDVGTINLTLKLGNNVSNIIWYNTYTEKD